MMRWTIRHSTTYLQNEYPKKLSEQYCTMHSLNANHYKILIQFNFFRMIKYYLNTTVSKS